MSRLCIFVFYDSDGIVDEYVMYLLKEVKKICGRIIIASNNPLIFSEKAKLESITKEIIIRENIGFDAGAYKEILLSYIGFQELKKYDELILMNDTVYGPFYPLEKIFIKMEKKYDFWGITKQAAFCTDYGIVEENIQSYFLVFNSNVLNAKVFEKFWNMLPIPKTFKEDCIYFENTLSSVLIKAGFRWGAVVESDAYDSDKAQKNFNHYAYIMGQLVQKYNMPFLKKKPFATCDYSNTMQGELKYAINYLENHSDYDVNLIWKNILRTYSIDTLVKTMNLYEIIMPDYKRNIKKNYPECQIVCSIHSSDSLSVIHDLFVNICGMVSVIVITSQKEIYDTIEEFSFTNIMPVWDKTSNRFNSLHKALKLLNKQSGFVCYVQDDIYNKQKENVAVTNMYLKHSIESILADNFTIEYIMNKFKKEPLLGLIVSLSPFHGIYWTYERYLLNRNKNSLRHTAEEMNINKFVDFSSAFLNGVGPFWCRVDILRKIYKQTNKIGNEFSILALLPYLFQNEKFYTKVMLSSDYAALQLAGMQYFLGQINSMYYENNKLELSGGCMLSAINFDTVMKKAVNSKRIYIYGAGAEAKKSYKKMKKSGIKIDGFIVSPGQYHKKSLSGIQIMSLEELIPFQEDDCIIIAVNSTNKAEIMPLLKTSIGTSKIYCL